MPWLKLSMTGKPFIWAWCEPGGEPPRLRYTPDGIEAKPAMTPDEKSLMWVTKRVPTFDMVEQMKTAKKTRRTKMMLPTRRKKTRSASTCRAKKRRRTTRATRSTMDVQKQVRARTSRSTKEHQKQVRAQTSRSTRLRSHEHGGRRREALYAQLFKFEPLHCGCCDCDTEAQD
jgi:hypothetical protein